MTPVQELFDKIWKAEKDELIWNAILKEAVKREREELDDRWALGWKQGTLNVKRKLMLEI